jgi:hypothetical protein
MAFALAMCHTLRKSAKWDASHRWFREGHLLLLDDLEASSLHERLHLVNLARLDGIGLNHGIRALRVEATTPKSHGLEASIGRDICLYKNGMRREHKQ